MKFIIKFTTTHPNIPELTPHMTRNVGGFAKRKKVFTYYFVTGNR
jgi:hypothetical protein